MGARDKDRKKGDAELTPEDLDVAVGGGSGARIKSTSLNRAEEEQKLTSPLPAQEEAKKRTST